MSKSCLIGAVGVVALLALAIGFGVYLHNLYASRCIADEAILKKVNLEAGILSREGYIYHVVFSPPFNKNFRDADLRHLAEIKHLDTIWVQQLPFTDQSLEELAKLRNLRHILLENTKVTDEGVDRLRKALPQTEILVTD